MSSAYSVVLSTFLESVKKPGPLSPVNMPGGSGGPWEPSHSVIGKDASGTGVQERGTTSMPGKGNIRGSAILLVLSLAFRSCT